jgi:hypothetical protein
MQNPGELEQHFRHQVRERILDAGKVLGDVLPGTIPHIEPRKPRYRFAQTIVTRKVVERGLLPQRAPFSRGTSGYALNVPLQ